MTNLTKVLITSGIVGAGIIATPIIYNNQINKFIQQEKLDLQAQNIELKENKNSDTFFEAKREYIVTIKDVTPIIQELYPQIDFDTLKDLKEAFDNTRFLVTLDMIKFPVYHKDAVKIDLYSLNDNSTKELSNDKTGKQLLEAIKNRAFEAILDINNLKISKAKLKDIDLTLDNSANSRVEKFNLKIQNTLVNVENNDLKISKIATTYTKKSEYTNETINFNINDINEKIKQQNALNYSSILKVSSVNFNKKSKYNNANLSIKDFLTSNTIKTIANKTSINNKINVKNIKFNADNNYIDIDKFVYNFNLLNLDSLALKKIVDMVNSNNLNDTQKLAQNLNQLIQKGFKVSISPLSINGIKGMINNKNFDIKPIELNLDATLLPNNYTLESNNPAFLSNEINAKLKVQTSPDNIDLLNKINPQVGMMINLISKKVNNKILINIEYQNGKLTSNGKPLIQ
jgi:hypothetical protein